MSRIIANSIRHNDATADSLSFDSSARVGIGTSSPAVTVHAEAAQAELQLKSTSGTNSAGLRFVPGGQTNALYIYADGSRNINFDDHATARLQIQSDGDLSISNGNLVVADGHGIDFSATAGPTNGTGTTGTSELLDDYEEGTWTPNLEFNGGDTGITYASRSGQYTKIGNRVYYTCYFYLTSKGTSTGIARVQGFPYTSLGSSNYLTAALWMSSGNYGSTLPTGYLEPGTTQFRLERQRADGGGIYTCDQTNFNNNTEIMITGHYSVS